MTETRSADIKEWAKGWWAWSRNGNGNCEGCFVSHWPDENNCIVIMTVHDMYGQKECEEVAALAAAAPKMKAALEETHIMISELIHDVGEEEEVTLQQLADLQAVAREALKDISDD